MGKPQHLSPYRIGARCEVIAEKVREASDLIAEIIQGSDSETARTIMLLTAGISDATADLILAFGNKLEADFEATLADEDALPLGFDIGFRPSTQSGPANPSNGASK